LDEAFEPFQFRQNHFFAKYLLEDIIEKYTNAGQADKIDHLLFKILEISEIFSTERFWSIGLKIAHYYAKAGLEEQETNVIFQILEADGEKTDGENEKFYVGDLTETAVRYAEAGKIDLVLHLLSQLLESAKETKKSGNKIELLTAASSIYEKLGKKPNRNDTRILHDIVSAIDPLNL
jgi:hypothetical protein